MSEGIASYADGKPGMIAGHRRQPDPEKRSPTMATMRQPPSTQNSTNSYIRS
jgi:hypothetical protein